MSDKHKEYIKRLDKIERDISWIIQYLLKRDKPISQPPYIPTYESNTTCSKCGLTFDRTTSYWCINNECPLFTKTSSIG
jgi:hypothetical protein